MNYTEMSNEALITMLTEDPNNGLVLEELAQRLRPTILGEAMTYRKQLPYETDDYMQEGRIVLWEIASRKSYKKGNFKNYYISAIRFRYRRLYRDYVLKNLIRIGGYEDIRGNTYEILVEADFAKEYRERHREECRRSAAKKKERERAERERLGIPEPQPKPKLSEEEVRERRRARSLAYYHAHADEMNARAKAKRKAKREEKEAAKTVQTTQTTSFQPCPV